jgi:RNA-directed DNA polymerase
MSYWYWIKEMLKSGFIDLGSLSETNEGTPQGGVISPALCNLVVRQVLDIPIKKGKWIGIKNVNIVSYADDAVITISPNLKSKPETVEMSVTRILSDIIMNLSEAGLELKQEKTRVIWDETPFDFLGFEISRGRGIRPSKKKLKNHHKKVTDLLKKGSRISNVNSTIRGFYNYYAHFSSGKMWKSLRKLDWYNGRWLWKKGMDPKKIVTYTDIPKCTKYISPQRGATPLLPEYEKFFSDRKWTGRKKYLAKKQKGLCPICNQKLGNDPSHLETHHIKPKGVGGKDKNSNVWLIHQSCHHLIHQEGKL